MVTGYDGGAGNVVMEYKGGSDGFRDPMWTLFGAGTEIDEHPTAVNRPNGVTEFKTGTTANDSVGLTTPHFWRGRNTQNGVDREMLGTLQAKLRCGFPAQGEGFFFFGILDEQPGASKTVEEILTATAAGVITSVESDFAGWYTNNDFTNHSGRWRTVAINKGGGVKDATKAPVLTPYSIDDGATYANVSPLRMPTLEINVSHEGTVDFYFNGQLTRRAIEGVNPEENYSVLFVLQTDNTSANEVGVDYACAEAQRYYGPAFS